MRGVHKVADDRRLPFLPWIFRHRIGQQLCSRPRVVLVAPPVERLDGQLILACGIFHPVHPVHRGFVRQPHRFPTLRAVRRRDQEKNCAAVHRVAGIPFRAHRDFAAAVTVDIRRRDAHVVLFREILRDHEFLPRGIPIPNDLFFVGEQHVGLPVAIDVGDRESVADFDLRIDVHDPELRRRQLRRHRYSARQHPNQKVTHPPFHSGPGRKSKTPLSGAATPGDFRQNLRGKAQNKRRTSAAIGVSYGNPLPLPRSSPRRSPPVFPPAFDSTPLLYEFSIRHSFACRGHL